MRFESPWPSGSYYVGGSLKPCCHCLCNLGSRETMALAASQSPFKYIRGFGTTILSSTSMQSSGLVAASQKNFRFF